MTATDAISEQVIEVNPELKDAIATLVRIALKPEIKPMAFYTFQEVATAISVGYSTVSRAVQNEQLIPEYIGSEPRLRGREILRWLREGGKTGRSRRQIEDEEQRRGR